jgi:hypothetical protein
LAVKLHLPKTYATSLLFNEDFFQVVTNMRIVAVADAVDSGVCLQFVFHHPQQQLDCLAKKIEKV